MVASVVGETPVDATGEGAVSVVIPVFNEAGSIAELVRETWRKVAPDRLLEIVVVDDGSDDGTEPVLSALLAAVPSLRVLRHARRAGQSAAIRTGVRAARAGLVATMDGDGQNDPGDIERALGPLGTRDVALVGGLRRDRQAFASKRMASRFANWLRRAVLDDGCPDTGCGLKAFRREAYLELPYFAGQHRYLPALFAAYGHGVAYVDVNDRPRRTGTSKYSNLGRALVGIRDLAGVSWLIQRTHLPTALRQFEPHPAAQPLAVTDIRS